MHVEKTIISPTEVKLVITATEPDLLPYKNKALNKLSRQVKLAGFREGKAPLSVVEKNVDQTVLQNEFLDEALTDLYAKAADQEKVRPVTRPEVAIKKFVPFTELEYEIKTQIIGEIKLANYKTSKATKQDAIVTAKDVDNVIESLRTRLAEKNDVEREAKNGDQIWIDFEGVDTKSNPIAGADGKDYPLALGSKTFIPGFEENLIGAKPGDEKTFDVTFPKDYGASHLAGKKATFKVKVNKVQELVKPEVGDELAKKSGPFTTLKELKDDIKNQLKLERENEVTRAYHNEIVNEIVEKSKVVIPDQLIDQQTAYGLDELRRNLSYQGQTYEKFLELEGTTQEAHMKEVLRPQAEKQVKTSLILAEIAAKENIVVTPEELEIRIQLLKGQHQDPATQAELDKPENRQDVASRMMTDKVLAKLEQYSNNK